MTGASARGPSPVVADDPVLAAAQACIVDVGLRRTTLADVARRAGVSRMTVYRAHGDLDAIVSKLLTAELVAIIDSARAEVAERESALDRLVGSTVLIVRDIGVHPVFRRVLDLDPELLLPLIVERLGSTQRVALEHLAETIAEGQGDGSVRPVNPRAAALFVLLTAQSFVFSARVVDAEAGAETIGDELGRLLAGYLRA